MIDYINKNFKQQIITIEDPVECAFKNKESLINQREI
jgi:Tfp pilus assembly pilus retraction ATPase PilT